MTKVCLCCGHPLPSHEVMLELSPMQQRMVIILQKAGRAGVPAGRLVDLLYSEDQDGGPITAYTSICTQRIRMRPKLQKHGLRISYARAKGSVWRLEAL